MGSTYVFIEQCTAELLLLYSRGSHALYRRLVSYNYAVFCVSLVSDGYIALLLYEAVGPTAAFYVCSVGAALYAAVFGAFYLVRLRGTTTGVLGGLRAAEDERLGQVFVRS